MTSRRRHRYTSTGAVFLFGVAAVAACTKASKSRDDAAPPSEDVARQEIRVGQTTPPEHAVRTLEAHVADREQKLASERDSKREKKWRRELVSLHLQRARYLGKIESYGAALAHADALTESEATPEDLVLRARARMAVHLFELGSADLTAAEKAGDDKSLLEPLEAAYLHAVGREAESLPIRKKHAERYPNLRTLSAYAIGLGAAGRFDEADQYFERSLTFRPTGDPFAVSQIWFSQGLMWEQQGKLSKARRYYELAHERLPQHASLTAHLAEVLAKTGERERAIKLVDGLVEQSDDPEYKALLSRLLREAGNTERADALLARAKTDYPKLLAKLPTAFADHGARFYLGEGADPARALELARMNLKVRSTDAAFQLALDAADAAKLDARGHCELADKALAQRSEPTAYLLFAAARALRSCDRTREADALLERAASAVRAR